MDSDEDRVRAFTEHEARVIGATRWTDEDEAERKKRALRASSASNITYEGMARDAESSWLPTEFETMSFFGSSQWIKGVSSGTPSNAPYCIVVEVIAPVARWLIYLCKRVGIEPEEWIDTEVRWIPKPWKPLAIKNHRGMSLLDTVSKVYGKLLTQTTEFDSKKRWPTTSFGRPGRGTADAIACIIELRRRWRKAGKDLQIFLSAASAAFG
jgi:hypothetical protein